MTNPDNHNEIATYCPNRIHQHKDGSWWFWDETDANELGPYASESYCKDQTERYGDYLTFGVSLTD